MREHLRALADVLDPLGYPVHLFYAEGATADVVPPVPYLVLRAGWDYGEDVPVCSTTAGLDTSATVICAASTAEGASVVTGRVGALVSPGGAWEHVPMAGRTFWVRATGFTEASVDRDLRLPNSNTHPGVAHVLLRLHSEPL